MPVRENKVKQILRAGGTIYSSSVRLPEPGLCELLGYAGFDFVLIDGEHGAVDAATIERAKAMSGVATAYINAVKVELDAIRLADDVGLLPGSIAQPVRLEIRGELHGGGR